mmetsp:Transcript_86044/g.243060  ORF Transcript_86044/g.243060 Transcript_86044/m.243060 type:complete len:293 (+) Transcript_86044:100-978(+)
MWWNVSFVVLLVYLFRERLLGLLVGFLLFERMRYDTRLRWLTIRPALPGTSDHTEVTCYDFRWLNPKDGYKKRYFIKVRQLTIKFDLVSLFSAALSGGATAIQVDEILVNGVRVMMERHKNGELNATKILGANEAEAKRLLEAQQTAVEHSGAGEVMGDDGASDDEEVGEGQFGLRSTGPLRRALGVEPRAVRKARRAQKKAEKLEAEKSRLPYTLCVDRFFLLDAQADIKDFLITHGGGEAITDAKPIKIRAFQLWGKKDFVPNDPDQEGLHVDEFIGRLVTKIIAPVLQV